MELLERHLALLMPDIKSVGQGTELLGECMIYLYDRDAIKSSELLNRRGKPS